jgi:hypothetical protein
MCYRDFPGTLPHYAGLLTDTGGIVMTDPKVTETTVVKSLQEAYVMVSDSPTITIYNYLFAEETTGRMALVQIWGKYDWRITAVDGGQCVMDVMSHGNRTNDRWPIYSR